MKRLVWGLILAGFGVIALMGSAASNQHEGDGMSVLLILGGGAMVFFGWQYIKRAKEVASIALQMIREDGKIDAALLAQRMGLSEVDIRPMIAEAQRKGIIGFKVEIV
jgi:hypothetical protein